MKKKTTRDDSSCNEKRRDVQGKVSVKSQNKEGVGRNPFTRLLVQGLQIEKKKDPAKKYSHKEFLEGDDIIFQNGSFFCTDLFPNRPTSLGNE